MPPALPIPAATAAACAALALVATGIARAEDRPATSFALGYVAEGWAVVDGGVRRGGRYLDDLLAEAAFDAGRAWGADGVHAYGSVRWDDGREFAGPYAGAAQGVSSIEAVRAFRVYEAWLEVPAGPGTLRAGLYDLNSEFDVNATGATFVHPAHGMGTELAQSGRLGPSAFPATALALRWRLESAGWVAGLAVLDGVPADPRGRVRDRFELGGDDGALLVAEIARAVGDGRVRAAVGAWRYTAEFDEVAAVDATGAPRRRRGTGGAYALLEAPLAQSAWRGFVRVGRADPRVHAFGWYLGGGLVREAPFGRAGDAFGIAFASARPGGPTRDAATAAGTRLAAAETALEATWRIALGAHLALQPDLQYLHRPSADPAIADAWILGLRVVAAWGGID